MFCIPRMRYFAGRGDISRSLEKPSKSDVSENPSGKLVREFAIRDLALNSKQAFVLNLAKCSELARYRQKRYANPATFVAGRDSSYESPAQDREDKSKEHRVLLICMGICHSGLYCEKKASGSTNLYKLLRIGKIPPKAVCEPSDLRRRVRFLVRVTSTGNRKSRTTVLLSCAGDSYGNRTHVFSVRG